MDRPKIREASVPRTSADGGVVTTLDDIQAAEVKCADCGRPRSLRVGDCQDTGNCIDYLRSRFAELEASLSAATARASELERELEGCVTVDSALAVQDELQRECDAWRALATGLAGEEELMFANLPDAFRVFCAADVGEGSSWGAAAADLAERLGLIAGGKTNG